MPISGLVYGYLLLLLPAILLGQKVVQPLPPAPPAPAPDRITLDVVVNDSSDKPVSGLTVDNFTILDDKQPQKILSFRAMPDPASAEPLEVILILDAVNTSYTNMAYERGQLEKFLRQNEGKLPVPVSLGFLTDTGLNLEGESSTDGNALVTYLEQNPAALRIITRSQGFYGADQRLQLSINAFQQVASTMAQRPGRKLVICLSPGWPLLSNPNITLTNKDKQGIFDTIVSLSTRLREAGVTLYAVDTLGPTENPSREFYYEAFLKGVRSPRDAQFGNLSLEVLAAQSGGRALNAGNDVADKIQTCVRDAAAYYVLTFAAPAADSPNEYHAIIVKIDRPRLKVQTRAGYYSQPRTYNGAPSPSR